MASRERSRFWTFSLIGNPSDAQKHASHTEQFSTPVEYDAVVAMGCGDEGCPLVRAKRREEWNIPDPKELPPDRFREIRDLIEKKVKELLHGL